MENILEKLITCFYGGNSQFHLTTADIKNCTWEVQHKFLELTVLSNRLKKYPANSDYTKLFFKKLIALIQPFQEIHHDVYTTLCSAVSQNHAEDYYYKHYMIGNTICNLITLKETKNLVVNGTTGMKTWEAAIMLSDWVLCNKQLFCNNNILELGSGVGLTGIAIAKTCDIQSIYLTDCHLDVLQTLANNIEINFPNVTKECYGNKTVYKKENIDIGIMPLDWYNLEDVPDHRTPDVLLGADIVYDPSMMKPLCDVFQKFFRMNEHLNIYVMSVVRNEDTFNMFREHLDKMKFKIVEILHNKPVNMHWNVNTKKCLLKISKI